MSHKLLSAARLKSTSFHSVSLVFQFDFDNFVIRKSGFKGATQQLNKTVHVLKRRLLSQLRRSR